MEHKELGYILTEEQLEQVTHILNLRVSDEDMVHRLKRYLRTQNDHLLKAGLVPDYLAYVIAFNAQQSRLKMAGQN